MRKTNFYLLMSYLSVASRVLVGVYLIYASYEKILEPTQFAQKVDAYQILPAILVSPFALILPWVEFLCGVLLVLGVVTRAAGTLVLGMLVIFVVAIGSAMARHLNIECGCLGGPYRHEPIGWAVIIRDVVLAVLTVHAMLYDRRTAGLEFLLSRKHVPTEVEPTL